MPFAFMPNLNLVTLLQLDGLFTPDEFRQALELAQQGARRVYEIQREALIKKYFSGGAGETTVVEEGE